MILVGRSFGLTDATGNTYGFPRVVVYGPDGKLKFPSGGGPGGTYTVSNGLTESPPNNFQLGGTLAANTTILGNSNLYDLSFTSLYSSTIDASEKIFFEANNGTVNTFLHLNPQSTYTKWTYDDGINLNEIEMIGTRMYIRTPDYTTAANGDVLTLLDNTTGEVEFQTSGTTSGDSISPFLLMGG